MQDLPSAVAAFFASENGKDAECLGECFTPDAVVRDEKRDYRGIEAIKAWRLDAQAKTPFTSRPLGLLERDGRFVVSTQVSGAFPNSPVILDHEFTLVDGRIASLEIS